MNDDPERGPAAGMVEARQLKTDLKKAYASLRESEATCIKLHAIIQEQSVKNRDAGYWINDQRDEIDRLKAENERLRELVTLHMAADPSTGRPGQGLMEDTMEKFVQFEPAFDKRNPDPSKNYGIHGVNIRFILKGDEGAVQFLIFTNWQLPHVTQEQLTESAIKGTDQIWLEVAFLPMPADVGYHSRTPTHEGQEPIDDNCKILGGTCYYDGSGLHAKSLFDKFLAEGDAAVWRELEEYYQQIFTGLKHA